MPLWRTALAGAGLALLWFILCRQLSNEWSANEQYSYGWFVPFFAAFLFWLRWEDRPEVGGQKSEVRSRSPDVAGPTSDLRPPTSAFDIPQSAIHAPQFSPFLLYTFYFLLLAAFSPCAFSKSAIPIGDRSVGSMPRS